MNKAKTIVLGLMLMVFSVTTLISQETIKLMTYNIKLDYPKEGDNSWNNRKDWMIGQINFYAPDIFGVQEAMPNQMKYMDSTMVNYNFVGVGRDNGKDEGEYSAIFYDKSKFRIVESSTFWLSQTPQKVSMGWDAVCNRVCTYALFENVMSKKQFWVFNTHLDHVGQQARMNSVKLILEKIKSYNTKDFPVFLMGDFNLEPETEHIQLIKTTLEDSKDISLNKPFGPSGTFNGFHFGEPVTRRIDYIFVTKNNIEVQKYAVLSDSKDLKYPSDHFPVFIEIKLTN
ncbi:MAG: endonuclease/exonuclease/phosphatase family protein [Gelidibacter sp.]